jgi:hypothetical protein
VLPPVVCMAAFLAKPFTGRVLMDAITSATHASS